MLEVAFATQRLRNICESRDAAEEAVGPDDAEQLAHRLADLFSADHVSDLIAGQPRSSNDDPRLLVIEIGKKRLLLAPNHQHIPRTQGGEVDWARVDRVKIVSIEGDDDEEL